MSLRLRLFPCVFVRVADLPHANDGVGDEDEEDDKRLNEGCDCFLTFLEPSQHLRETESQLRLFWDVNAKKNVILHFNCIFIGSRLRY